MENLGMKHSVMAQISPSVQPIRQEDASNPTFAALKTPRQYHSHLRKNDKDLLQRF